MACGARERYVLGIKLENGIALMIEGRRGELAGSIGMTSSAIGDIRNCELSGVNVGMARRTIARGEAPVSRSQTR